MTKALDLTGKKFGRWTVLEFSHIKNGNYYWLCKCECGTIKPVSYANLKRGSKSCGCLAKEILKEKGTHKQSGSRLYVVWQNMKSRCYNKNNNRYNIYGARGIKVCDEWQEFQPFYDWAMANGYNPNAKRGECTIDRIDVNGDYEPNNCRFVSMEIQTRNTRVNRLLTYNNETHCLQDWSKITGINISTLDNRLYRDKLPVDKILSVPTGKLKKIKKIKCIETGIIYESAKDVQKEIPNINISTLYKSCRNQNRTCNGYHWEYVE